MTQTDLLPPVSDRDQFNLRLGKGYRDRVIAAWIDGQIARDFDVSNQMKDLLYEMITGLSSITGRALGVVSAAQGESPDVERDLLGKLKDFPD